MSLDLEALTAPLDGEDPGGPDLTYDEERVRIEEPFQRSASVDPTDPSQGAAETDWRPTIPTPSIPRVGAD